MKLVLAMLGLVLGPLIGIGLILLLGLVVQCHSDSQPDPTPFVCKYTHHYTDQTVPRQIVCQP